MPSGKLLDKYSSTASCHFNCRLQIAFTPTPFQLHLTPLNSLTNTMSSTYLRILIYDIKNQDFSDFGIHTTNIQPPQVRNINNPQITREGQHETPNLITLPWCSILITMPHLTIQSRLHPFRKTIQISETVPHLSP